MKKENKSESMHFKLTPTDRKAAEIYARVTGQSLSSLIATALAFYVKKKCPLAYKHGAGMETANEEKKNLLPNQKPDCSDHSISGVPY